MKHTWILIIALSACGKKKEEAAPPPTPTPVATLDAAAAPTPPAEAVKLTAGQEPALGCFGWSSKLNAAACFTGTNGLGVDFEVTLTYAGAGSAPVAVTETLDQATIDGTNQYLAAEGFGPLAPPVDLAAGQAQDVGGVTFLWTRTQTDAGGENQPPSHKNELKATCGGKDTVLSSGETEGDNPKFVVHAQGDRLLVLSHMHVGREGESSNTLDVTVFNATTCAVTGK